MAQKLTIIGPLKAPFRQPIGIWNTHTLELVGVQPPGPSSRSGINSLPSLVKFPVGHLAKGLSMELPTGPGFVSWVPRLLPYSDFLSHLRAPDERTIRLVPSSLDGLGLAEPSNKQRRKITTE